MKVCKGQRNQNTVVTLSFLPDIPPEITYLSQLHESIVNTFVLANIAFNQIDNAKRIDLTREVSLIKLPSITNYLSSNCLINFFLHIFSHKNIAETFNIGKESIIYQFMEKLYNGESLTQDDINKYRLEIIPAFFLSG